MGNQSSSSSWNESENEWNSMELNDSSSKRHGDSNALEHFNENIEKKDEHSNSFIQALDHTPWYETAAAVALVAFTAYSYWKREEKEIQYSSDPKPSYFFDDFNYQAHIKKKRETTDQIVLDMGNRTKNRRPRENPRTSYQDNMCFGKFKCSDCKRNWTSSSSWANSGQKCKKCLGDYIYPYEQRDLKEAEWYGTSKPHPDKLCEKCHRLGCYCRRALY